MTLFLADVSKVNRIFKTEHLVQGQLQGGGEEARGNQLQRRSRHVHSGTGW